MRILILALKDKPRSPSELKDITGFSIVTIWRNCNRLIRIGLVAKDGKNGKYRLTVDNYIARKATKFCNMLLNQFVGKMLIHDNPFCVDYLYHKDYIINEIKKSLPLLSLVKSNNKHKSETEEENIDDLIIQLQIHEFSRAIGAYITYVLIHAVSEYLWRPRTNFEVDIMPDGKEKSKSTEEWVKNSIDPTMLNKMLHLTLFQSDWIKNAIIPRQILDKFSRLEAVQRGQKKGSLVPIPKLSDLPKNEHYSKNKKIIDDLARAQRKLRKATRYPLDFDLTREDHKKKDEKVSEYEVVDKTLHEKLMKAYKNIYPDYYDKLEDIRKEVDVYFSP